MMIAQTSGPDLEFFDGRAYTLMVTVRASDGMVEIQHQALDDADTDRQMARLAAEIIDQIGPQAVAAILGADDVKPSDIQPFAVNPPPPGTAVMRCRCGRMLDLRQMHRLMPPRDNPADTTVLHQIVCLLCAVTAGAAPVATITPKDGLL